MLPGRNDKVDIDVKEVYRYLGYRGTRPEEAVVKRVDECIAELVQVSELRSRMMRFDLKTGENSETGRAEEISIGGISITSGDLARHLEGCVEVYLFGATIGVGVDRLIAKATVGDVLAAAIYQAAGAAYIESYCDLIQKEVQEKAREGGRTIVSRFSPGYGDLKIGEQRKFFDLLDLTRQTGIALTDGMLMMPSKSVTAIIGVRCEAASDGDTEKGRGDRGHDCSLCGLENCQFRKI